jgi:hypothetical protein
MSLRMKSRVAAASAETGGGRTDRGEKGIIRRNARKLGAAALVVVVAGGGYGAYKKWGPQGFSAGKNAEIAAIDSLRDSKDCLPVLNSMVQLPAGAQILENPTRDSKVASKVKNGDYGMLRRPAVYTDPTNNIQYWLVRDGKAPKVPATHKETRTLADEYMWVNGTAILAAAHAAKGSTGYALFDLGKPEGAQMCSLNLAGEITSPGDVVLQGAPNATDVSVLRTYKMNEVQFLTDTK